MKLNFHIVFSVIIVVLAICCAAGSNPQPAYELRVEYLEEPWGVDVEAPRFSWIVPVAERGAMQTAYRIIVKRDDAVAWDSGMVKSSMNSQIAYAGKPLQSDSTYTWTVSWWDGALQEAPASDTARFHTGLMHNGWTASWIGGFNQLRSEFVIGADVREATAYVSGLGYYEMFLNGEKVGRSMLDPGWTTYNTRVLYSSYDVTRMLVKGVNAVGALLGSGWYVRDKHGPLSLLLQINMKYANGTTTVVTSNTQHWRGVQGPITYDDIYNGEVYDARLETPGWSVAGFNDSVWKPATAAPAPGVMSSQMMQSIRIVETRHALSVNQPQPDVYVYDFGQNFAGFCRLRVVGPAGVTVKMRFAEILDHDGSGMIYTANLRSAKATDLYTLKGDPRGEEYTPHFTYHGFRYVELTGFPGVPDENTLLGLVMHTDVRQTGNVMFSADILNEIQHNIVWGQRSNLMSLPTDCDQRDERKGWMGDAALTVEEAMHNFDVAALFTNFLRDIRDIQAADGSITDTVPFTFGSRPADPAWGAAYPTISYLMWKHYGDERIVKEYYDSLVLYIDSLTAAVDKTGLAKMYSWYGDWVPPPPHQRADSSLVSAFSYIQGMQQVLEMAQFMHDSKTIDRYTALLQKARQDFNTAWFNSTAGSYCTDQDGFQTANSLAIAAGAPTSNPSVGAALVQDVEARDTHLTTGIVGTKYLMESLTATGHTDVALKLAEKTDYPSWGYMVRNTIEPATTLWELWDSPSEGPDMNSRNHIMFGSVGNWFYKTIAGIDQTANSTGYDEIVINPFIGGDLTTVSASIHTPHGTVSMHWQSAPYQCGSADENTAMTLSCWGGTISSVTFASFGTPAGSCGEFSIGKCHAANSEQVVRDACIGKQSCTVQATDSVFGDPCYGTLKRLVAQATCSSAVVTVSVEIPASTRAHVHVPLVGGPLHTAITESGTAFWRDGKYLGGVSGVLNASVDGDQLVIVTAAGEYTFVSTSD